MDDLVVKFLVKWVSSVVRNESLGVVTGYLRQTRADELNVTLLVTDTEIGNGDHQDGDRVPREGEIGKPCTSRLMSLIHGHS